MKATAFAPGSIGNVGPGFDVLGLAVEGIGDRVTVELTKGDARVDDVTGIDADLVPRDPDRNCAAIAAHAVLRGTGYNAIVSIVKGLPLAGGMGGSAASSVAGAFAGWSAINGEQTLLSAGEQTLLSAGGTQTGVPALHFILAAALEGESAVAGRHLDNIAPSVVGGLALSRSVDPIDVIKLPVAAEWWIALVTPRVRIQTKDARALLPMEIDRATWIQQMANTAALAHAFAVGDGALLKRALDDGYAEPHRAPLIPHFYDVKKAAAGAGAFGCSISGSGPTLFAIAENESAARGCAEAMQRAFREVESSVHIGAIAKEGVRPA